MRNMATEFISIVTAISTKDSGNMESDMDVAHYGRPHPKDQKNTSVCTQETGTKTRRQAVEPSSTTTKIDLTVFGWTTNLTVKDE